MEGHATSTRNSAVYSVLRIVSWIVLAVMILTIAYAAWQFILNWDAISV